MKLFKHNLALLFVILLLSFSINAQVDFNDFKNLKAQGEIPTDFIEDGFKKVKDDIDQHSSKLKGKEEKIFLEGVHYAINDLLHSGVVVYGDEVSNYVTKIADKLLEKDENTKRKLRFYTIKSNETNAFSTYQGIIFVTTGLLSQLTNEAQLAYVLSHEIAHYTEEHVVQTFDYNVKNKGNTDKIQSLSKFSKENEFEADKLGIKLYHDAGYSKAELISTFDVLLYSYLPFDEVEMPNTYLNSALMTIPVGFFSATKFPIKALEDADDSKSSHPNIKKRKAAVTKELENYSDWKNESYFFGKDEFKQIRTICRFESIRTDVVDGEFDDALYSIFLLEKEYPNSIYLKRMKAKSWLAIAQYRTQGGLRKMIPSKKDFEGEIANFQYFLGNLSKNQTVALSMRMVEDLKDVANDDPIVNGIWERMVKTMVITERLDLKKFSTKIYSQEPIEIKDTISIAKSNEKLNKYEKIKSKSNVIEQEYDSSKFYLYALSDLMVEKSFLDKYQELSEEQEEIKSLENKINNMSRREFKKYNKELALEKSNQANNSIICLEPLVYSYSSRGLNRVKSEKMQIIFTQALRDVSASLELNIRILGTKNLINEGTEAFNERSLLISYFSELTDNSKIEFFPTDYSLLRDLKEKTGTNKVMLSILQHERSNKVKGLQVTSSFLFYPYLLYYIPNAIFKANQVFYTSMILNLDTGEIDKKFYTENYETLDKFTIRARIYTILKNLN
jgi:hypothetical protein